MRKWQWKFDAAAVLLGKIDCIKEDMRWHFPLGPYTPCP